MPVDQEERTRRLKAKIRAKMDGLFQDRQFEVVTEITPEYLEGKVDAEGNPRVQLQTPLGTKGKNGWLVRLIKGAEIDTSMYSKGTINRDRKGQQWFFVGHELLRQMADDYGAVDRPLSKREQAKLAKIQEAMS